MIDFVGISRLCVKKSQIVSVLKTPERGDEARLLSSFLGWLDRHFGEQLSAVNIQYQQASGRGRR